jgi:hypothetical protein
VVNQRHRAKKAGGGTIVDALFELGDAAAPQWVLRAKPFGTGGHVTWPAGFVPANFLLGANLGLHEYGGYPKSMCTLGSMRAAWERKEQLFTLGRGQAMLSGMWPHHCLMPSVGWSFPVTEARLNHYATGDETTWREKCGQPNPTFKGNSRAGRKYCDGAAGMQQFLAGLDNHTDLHLFTMLGGELGRTHWHT